MGKIRFAVDGVNLDRLLSRILNEGIEVSDLTRAVKRMEFSVPYERRKTVLKIAAGYKISTVRLTGAPRAADFFKKRPALILGAVILIFAAFFAGSFIWEVKITGTENVGKEEILAALSGAGARRFTAKSALDPDKVEAAVIARCKGVSYVNVYARGVTLFVEIFEALPQKDPADKTPADIVAAAAGKITRIVTVAGTALVKEGDTVEAGQVLISKSIIYPDGTGAEVRAAGEVYADVTCTGIAWEYGYDGDEGDAGIEKLKRAAYADARKKIPEKSTLKDVKYDIIINGNLKTVTAALVAERRIDR